MVNMKQRVLSDMSRLEVADSIGQIIMVLRRSSISSRSIHRTCA